MKVVLHKAEQRGRGEHGWLQTRYSFSFADWYEPSRMGFGALRVINDDQIAPANGFGAHGHKDMEIITVVLEGAVTHEDSMGNRGVVAAGEVQVMSAGTGVVHAETNDSSETPLKLFQIWIEPKAMSVAPRYAQKVFDPKATALLVAPDEREGALAINQDAFVTRAVFDHTYSYTLRDSAHGAYIFVVSGAVEVGGHTLNVRDAAGVTDSSAIELVPIEPSEVLIFDVPME